MTAAAIVALRPNVTQAEAIREFSKIGISSVAWRVRAGVLQRIANAYVPYQFYEVSYTMARAQHTRLFAMDAVDGSLAIVVQGWVRIRPTRPFGRRNSIRSGRSSTLNPSLAGGAPTSSLLLGRLTVQLRGAAQPSEVLRDL